mmetsp:Transcript_28977/g.44554  ORF Transcript_28977/g.44554 Transcript_28977/m.44554 type:complete len:787 (+) Transcript_28977:12-2372(+)
MKYSWLSVQMLASASLFLSRRTTTALVSNSIWKRPTLGQKPLSTTSRSLQSSSDTEFDVIIVGGGHAGCDAAAAAARTGAKTALVTQRLDTIGELSCNPSIGGIGKGHLVREIDALDGVIGKVADEAGVHYRVLNRRKGPAVRGPRAQMDRDLYKAAMQSTLDNYENLSLVEASVQDLLLDESKNANMESLAPMSTDIDAKVGGLLAEELTSQNRKARIQGVVVTKEDGTQVELNSRAVVITTGTFLRGVLLLGHERYSGGRHLRDSEEVEPPSVGLAQTLARYQFPLGRLKTGTPPRLDGRTINWDACPAQPSEIPATPFSHILQFHGQQPPMIAQNKLITCHQSATNDETHKLVLKYEDTLPIYDGMDGAGNGPRYCPSIYKKVQRFPERNSHNCFLEPEGLNTDIVYPNGMSGPYPEDVQLKIMRSMKGLEECEIVRPGYDVEYDFVNPQSLTHTLETKSIGGLYLAGQICGTTGYEEAAAQGIVAGANAGRAAGAAARGDKPPSPFIVGRDEGYIGVLIDDLVTRGTSEPYRMFTSRAEYRMSLRADNADIRLTRKGMDYGFVRDEERIACLEDREYIIEDRIEQLRKFNLKVPEWAERGGNELMGGAKSSQKTGQKKSAEEVLGMPHVTLKAVEDIMVAVSNEERAKAASKDGEADATKSTSVELPQAITASPQSVHDTVEAVVKYKNYVVRQNRDMESWRKAQGVRIPPDLIYDQTTLPTLSSEELEKLSAARPNTFAEASQISGITPQSLIYLHHYIRMRSRKREGKSDVKKVSYQKQN